MKKPFFILPLRPLIHRSSFIIHNFLPLLLTTTILAQTTATAPAPANLPSAILPALEMLQRRGTTLQDFTAKIRKQDTTRFGDEEIRLGNAAYQKTAGVTKLGAHFDILRVDGINNPLDEDMIFDGRLFIHRDAKNKTFEKRELVPPGKNFDPLKLGTGPLPLPIGQDPQEILKNFTVTNPPIDAKLLPPNYKAADLILLRLVPITANKYSFTTADLYIDIDPKLELPIKVTTTSADKAQSSVTFSELKINQGNPPLLEPKEPPKNAGWTVTNEPYQSPEK